MSLILEKITHGMKVRLSLFFFFLNGTRKAVDPPSERAFSCEIAMLRPTAKRLFTQVTDIKGQLCLTLCSSCSGVSCSFNHWILYLLKLIIPENFPFFFFPPTIPLDFLSLLVVIWFQVHPKVISEGGSVFVFNIPGKEAGVYREKVLCGCHIIFSFEKMQITLL